MPDMDINEVNYLLTERTKELTCLYEVEEILEDYTSPVQTVLNKVCVSIEKAMQFAEICRCQIIINQDTYCNTPFTKTELKLFSKLMNEGHFVEIDVFYIKPIKDEHHPIFLAEEQSLVQNICKKVSQYISYRFLRENIDKTGFYSLTKEKDEGIVAWLKMLSLSDNEIETITQKSILFKKGETICKQHTIANYIMIISEGYAKLFLEHFMDHNFIFKLVKPIDFIGLSSFNNEETYPFSVTALTNTKVYLIKKNVFDNIIAHNVVFSNNIINWYSKYFSLMLLKLNSISNKQALGRLADTLLYLSDMVFESPVIENFISRRDLAELSGLSTENTVRLLSELKTSGIVSFNRNEVHIVNKEKIISLSQHG